MRGRRSAAVAVSAGLAAATVGCSAPAPTVAPTPSDAPFSSTGDPAPTTWGDLPDPAAAVEVMPGQRGDCPIDPADHDIVSFVVATGDDRTPVRVTYPVFRVDGQRMVRRMTAPGPVITVVIAACSDGEPADLHGFRAATDDPVPLSCALFAGGELVAGQRSEPDAGATGSSVDCSGSPAR